MYVYVGCRETSIFSTKEFMIPIATPHELLMALMPEQFPWQSKVITDFQLLLPKLDENSVNERITFLKEETKAEQNDQLSLVAFEQRDLVPIFSTQILTKYQEMQYKGLDITSQ